MSQSIFVKALIGSPRSRRTRFDQDPFSGAVFLFRNRRATALKLLVYDGQGFWL